MANSTNLLVLPLLYLLLFVLFGLCFTARTKLGHCMLALCSKEFFL